MRRGRRGRGERSGALVHAWGRAGAGGYRERGCRSRAHLVDVSHIVAQVGVLVDECLVGLKVDDCRQG